MTTTAVKQENNQDAVLHAYGVTVTIAHDGATTLAVKDKTLTFDAAGTLLHPKEISAPITMSGSATAAFAVNDNSVEVSKVGYVTKASEGLSHRVVYLGSVVNKEGQTKHCYTTAKPIVTYDTWKNCDTEIENLNQTGEYSKEFGTVRFPTSRRGNTGTDELDMFYKNKDALGIKADWIHGEARDECSAYFLNCYDGDQDDGYKLGLAAAFPLWRVDHLVI